MRGSLQAGSRCSQMPHCKDFDTPLLLQHLLVTDQEGAWFMLVPRLSLCSSGVAQRFLSCL